MCRLVSGGGAIGSDVRLLVKGSYLGHPDSPICSAFQQLPVSLLIWVTVNEHRSFLQLLSKCLGMSKRPPTKAAFHLLSCSPQRCPPLERQDGFLPPPHQRLYAPPMAEIFGSCSPQTCWEDLTGSVNMRHVHQYAAFLDICQITWSRSRFPPITSEFSRLLPSPSSL